MTTRVGLPFFSLRHPGFCKALMAVFVIFKVGLGVLMIHGTFWAFTALSPAPTGLGPNHSSPHK